MTRPPWLIEADRLFDTREVVGPGSNPEIMRWAQNFGGWVKAYFKDDDVPWCALFANECLRRAGFPTTKDVLAAGSFRSYGILLGGPALGAIVCVRRPGGNHVGFYLGERADGAIRCRGGNQSNRVSDAWISGDRSPVYRWPVGASIPLVRSLRLADDGEALSIDET